MRVGYRVGAAVLLALFACGGTESTGPPIVSVVQVTLAEQTLDAGGPTIQFTATALDASGATISGKEFTWSSSDPSVMTIDSSTGLATVVGNGTTTIAATTDGVTGSTTLTIIPAPRISVTPDSVAFFGVAGTPPAPQTLSLTNGGGGTLGGLVAEVQFAPGQPTGWLTPVLAGTQAPTTLTLTPQTATLPVGVYEALVTVTSPDDDESPLLIPVTLSLTAEPPSLAPRDVNGDGQTDLVAFDPLVLISNKIGLLGALRSGVPVGVAVGALLAVS